MRSCGLSGWGFLPASVPCGFASFYEQVFDQLRSLHLVELLDAEAEQLLGQVLDFLLVDVVLVDDAQDESLLTIGALPAVICRPLVPVVTVGMSVGIDVVASAVLRGLWRVLLGLRNKARVLNFLVNGVLQKLVESLQFSFDLGDVGEFDFDGGAEAVAAVLRQAELFAVVGAEFDGHGAWWWRVMDTKKPGRK